MIDVELGHEVLDSLRAMKDRGTPLPRCHKGPIRGVELQVLWEDLGQGEKETVHRYQWTDGSGGVVLTGRDDSAVVTEG